MFDEPRKNITLTWSVAGIFPAFSAPCIKKVCKTLLKSDNLHNITTDNKKMLLMKKQVNFTWTQKSNDTVLRAFEFQISNHSIFNENISLSLWSLIRSRFTLPAQLSLHSRTIIFCFNSI